jgi:hypothetical protein
MKTKANSQTPLPPPQPTHKRIREREPKLQHAARGAESDEAKHLPGLPPINNPRLRDEGKQTHPEMSSSLTKPLMALSGLLWSEVSTAAKE